MERREAELRAAESLRNTVPLAPIPSEPPQAQNAGALRIAPVDEDTDVPDALFTPQR